MEQERNVVIITGSSGFIGSALIRALAARSRLVGFDKDGPPSPPPEAECVCIDLTSENGVAGAFERVRIAYGKRIASVIHLAAYYDLSGEPSPLYQKITFGGTERLLRHLRDFEVEQFIFASTMLVHAPAEPGHRISEASPVEPSWPYPESKIDTEESIRKERGDIPVVLLRIAGVYDDRCRNAFLSQQIARIYERQIAARIYPGDAHRGQAFIHLEDLTEAVVRLIERRNELPPELPLLVGESETLTYDEVQRIVGDLLYHDPFTPRRIPKALARMGAWFETEILAEDPFIKPWMVDFAEAHYELDITRARTLLDWEPKQSLRKTLPTMVAALEVDPSGWYRANKLNAALVAGDTAAKNIRNSEAASMDMEHAREKPGHSDVEAQIEHRTMMRKHDEMMLADHRSSLWAHFVNIGLGAWLVTTPTLFGLFEPMVVGEAVLRFTAERGLPAPEWRNAALGWSDIVSGLLIVCFGLLSLSRRTNWAQWASTIVGLWLLFAPLVFWAPSAAAYANDTLVGSLVIAFAVLVPMMPGMSMAGMMGGPDIPPGWTYCPSTWAQRLPVIVMGAIGFLVARHLAAYQLGHAGAVFEPFFSGNHGLNGSETIVTSDMSKAWPIPDGGLGAVSYMLEILMAAMGDKRRWRTMPWMVTFFGILVVPLGAVSIYFIIIQPIVIGTWCTLCLLAALAMLIMIPFSLDELVAMGQFMVWSKRAGRPFWRTFLMGDALDGGLEDKEVDLGSVRSAVVGMTHGVTMPWTLVASAVLGVWLMFTRLIFGTGGAMANSDHLVGALVVTVAVIAMAEVARPLRFINAFFGAWLVLSPWLLDGAATAAASWAEAVVGLFLICLSLPRGSRSRNHYAGWDRFVV